MVKLPVARALYMAAERRLCKCQHHTKDLREGPQLQPTLTVCSPGGVQSQLSGPETIGA
jgi:hypothetical protein